MSTIATATPAVDTRPFREYDAARDAAAVHRIWVETGWIENDDYNKKAMDELLTCGRTVVADIDGEPECLVLTTPGTVRHGDSDLSMSMVAGVTTSRIARKQRFAQRLTAEAVAHDAARGALVTALGMFEQGFYDRLGFGSGGYVHRYGFDPSQINVPGTTRPPRRLGHDDWAIIHANRLTRRRIHGTCNVTSEAFTHVTMLEGKKDFGLGYFDGPDGALSHHVWIRPRGGVEEGPYAVLWMVWNTRAQFLELMGLLRNLGDQVRLIHVPEPVGVQLQDLSHKPYHNRMITVDSKFDARMRVAAYWQMRINDVPGCLAATSLKGRETVRFNASLSDPIEGLLPADAAWRGAAGDYVVTLGETSSAKPGRDDTLPTLTATINAFTRLWLGIRPATGLSITTDLEGPAGLLETLDRVLCLPEPQPDWDF
jgi:hypothetical protein